MDKREKGRKTFSLDQRLIDELEEESNNASAVVNQLLDEYIRGGGEGPIGLEIKLQRTERKLQDELDKRERINRRIERLRNKRSRLEEEIEEKKKEQQQDVIYAAKKLRTTPLEPENPAVQTQAENIGMMPTELIRQIKELPAGALEQ